MRSEQRRKERRMRRNNIIIGLILLFTMVFSMLAVSFSNNNADPNLVYGNYTFDVEDVEGGQMATIKLNGQKYAFYTLPGTAEQYVSNLSGIREISAAQSIIFVKEPMGLNGQISSEQLYFDVLMLDVQAATGKMVFSGISEADEFSEKKVYTCEDASAGSPVLLLLNGTYTNINITEVEENCYEVASDSMSLLYMRDYIIYRSLGIITN